MVMRIYWRAMEVSAAEVWRVLWKCGGCFVECYKSVRGGSVKVRLVMRTCKVAMGVLGCSGGVECAMEKWGLLQRCG